MADWSSAGLNRNRRPGDEAGLGAAALRGGKKRAPETPAPKAAKTGFRFKGGKRGALIAAGAAGVAGGGAAVHHHMRKSLVNPFEEVVAFGKAYPVALPVQRAVRVRALLPTGAHVSHANKLVVVRRNGKGGPATKLERYAKGDFSKGSVANGLKMAAGAKGVMPIRTSAGLKPEGPLARRLTPNSKIPDAGRRGRRIA